MAETIRALIAQLKGIPIPEVTDDLPLEAAELLYLAAFLALQTRQIVYIKHRNTVKGVVSYCEGLAPPMQG